jgi:addiction module RelB/DinJ family antitoxin
VYIQRIYYVYMNTTVINIRTDKKIKAQAQKIAADLGFSLSSLLNAYLHQLVKTKKVEFEEEAYEPMPYLKRVLKQAEKNWEKGNYTKLRTPEEIDLYMKRIMK